MGLGRPYNMCIGTYICTILLHMVTVSKQVLKHLNATSCCMEVLLFGVSCGSDEDDSDHDIEIGEGQRC